MTINLSDNTPRVSYSVAQGVTQTSFTVTFEFFAEADLNVYVDGVLKTLTTDYTVSGGSGSTGTVTISVTGASGGSTVVITRDIALERTTDFPASGAFQIASLNTELDKITAQFADRKDAVDRSLRLQDSDAAGSMELPLKADRAGTVLGFNATTGVPEAGPTIADVSTLTAITADIATLADIEDGTDATDAIQTVAGISANVTTVAGVSANVTTVAGQTTNMQNITDNLSAVQNAATNATTATTKASEAATSATNAATSASSASASATAAQTAQTAAETAETNAETAETNAETAETNAASSATAAASSATTASGHATTATTKAGEAATSATNAATSATNAATSATNAATSETNASNSATAAASSASAASTSETNAANSAAAAASAFDNFDDTYLGSKTSDPTVDNDGDPLTQGDLYFNSTSNEMRVYDGANWIAASSAGAASLILYEYTATSGQTTFSGADDNAATLSYSVGNIQVVMNGVILDPSDFTATSGTSVVLATGATTGDLVNIYAFKSFTVADTVSASAGGTFAANVNFDANANFGDNDKAIFGAGSDLEIYHDGSNSYISEGGTGNLFLGATNMFLRSGTGETYLGAVQDGAVSLYHDNGVKLATTATGVDVTGDIAVDRVVNSGVASTASTPTYTWSGQQALTGMYLPSSSTIAFSTNATERMRISNTGIVTKPAQPSFRAVSTGSWTIPTSTFTIFPANSAVFNVGGGYNTGTYKFTAPVDGVYYFAGQWFGSVGSGRAIASIYKNDAQSGGSQSLSLGSTSGGGISYLTESMMQLDAGDTTSFQTYQESGSTVTANQTSHLSFWYGYLLG